MKSDLWRTGPPRRHAEPVTKPSRRQAVRQAVILLVVVAAWGGALALFISMLSPSSITIALKSSPTPTTVTSPTVVATATVATTSAPQAIGTTTATPTLTPRPVVTPTRTTAPPVTPSSSVTASVSFARDVEPIFNRICVKCHGGEQTQHGLVLKSYDDVMAGSDNGPVITPGDPANSVLIDMITQGKMPKNGPKLLPSQISVITTWVKEGAPNN